MRRLLPLLALLAVAVPAAASTGIRGTAANDFLQVAWGGKQIVHCGAGTDVVTADQQDQVAPDCEVVSRRLSVDTTTDVRAQHETAVEPDSFAWGSTVVAAFQLGRIASGASAAIGWATSTDAGRTWKRGVLPGITADSSPPGQEVSASDPTVAYDAVHGVWLIATLTLEAKTSHVLVARSADGQVWSTPVVAATGPVLDKDWIVCDNQPASPHRGRCYDAFSDDANNQTLVSWSDDGGATWSAPARASAILVGTQPLVLPNGTLVVVAGDYNGEQGLSGAIDSLVSVDGGQTYTRVTVATFQAAPSGPMRAISLPSVAEDAAGKLYAVWDDCRFRAGCTGNDLVLTTSTDGLSWTPPAQVPTSPARTTFLPAIAASQTQPGRLGLVYTYEPDGSCTAGGTCLLHEAFVSSGTGGTGWSAPQRLDAEAMQDDWLAETDQGRMLGDYVAASFAGSRVVPVFALAIAPLSGRLREAIFAASLPWHPSPGGRR
ncbi:MAG: exo-alpha-sialidase [Actinobacteria bacterium]|nr:exo-alpha-sialidase [Actinomycetota bacterium]